MLAIFLIGAGITHFLNPAFFLRIMPPYLPLHKELVLVSGIFEVLLGVLLLVPASSRWAAWGIVALLIAVFPANLYVFQHARADPSIAPCSSPASAIAGRLYPLGILVCETRKHCRQAGVMRWFAQALSSIESMLAVLPTV